MTVIIKDGVKIAGSGGVQIVKDGVPEIPSSGGSGTGEANTASSIGTGEALPAGKSGVNLQFKGLKVGGDLSIDSTSDSVTITGDNDNAEKFWTKDIEEPATSISDNNKIYTAKWLQNFIKHSEDISQSVWLKQEVTISGTAGLIPSAVNANHDIVQTLATATGTGSIHKLRFKLKRGVNKTWCRVRPVLASGTSGMGLTQQYIDLENGVFGADQTYITKKTIVEDTEGYYLIELEVPSTESITQLYFYIAESENAQAFTGNGTDIELYVKEVQINNSEIIDNLDYVQTLATAEAGRTEYKLTANYENSEDKDYISKSFYLNGEASGTIGLFVTSPVSVGNPSGALPLTSPYDMLQNNSVAPFIVPVDTVVTKIYLEVVRAAVSGSTVGGSPTVRIDFYTHQPATRTLLFTKRVPCTENVASIGIYNNLGGAGSNIIFELVVNEDLPKDTLIGWEFVNESGSDAINAVSGVFGTIRGYINE